jgi:hypothetical protein
MSNGETLLLPIKKEVVPILLGSPPDSLRSYGIFDFIKGDDV